MNTEQNGIILQASVHHGEGWELRRRGLKDALRHDKRVEEAIRKNLRELIGEEAIITSDGNRKVKIPLRYLDQYRFRYGNPQQGVGQGEGQPGDLLGRRQGDSNQPGDGTPGDQPGEHMYEVEATVDQLARWMLEGMSLPWLEEKPRRELRTITTEYTDRRRKGPKGLFDKRTSLIRNLKRNAAKGNPHVGDWNIDHDPMYKAPDEKEQFHSNAAVYMLMDVSGSMTTGKKYIAQCFFFWMVRFLRIKYKRVETVFIAHDTDAQILPEKDFFSLSNNGGTRCSSAYILAEETIDTSHPPSVWNNYLFHFSDGDNLSSDNPVCKARVESLLTKCNMVGYGEIRYGDDASFYGWLGSTSSTPSSLQYALKEINSTRLRIETITNKSEVHPALIRFLQADQAPPTVTAESFAEYERTFEV